MSRTALVLPGRSYGHRQPGVRLTELALAQAGLDVVRVDWPAAGMPVEPDEAADAVAAIAAPLLDDAPAYVVAKSLGTYAAPLAAERAVPAIWLTPLLDVPFCSNGILANPARQLLVGGDQDFAWDLAIAHRAADAGAEVVQLPGADHGFEVPGDAVASAQTLLSLAHAVTTFLHR